MKMLNQALVEPGNIHSYFIRTYKSAYLKKLHHYSAYVPDLSLKTMPVFIILDSQDQKVDDWTEHWRNSVADGVDQIIDLANDIGFIPVWTDCGGGKDPERLLSVFSEIHEDIIKTLPVDTNRVFLMGICESTSVSLLLLHHYPDKIQGCGFVNPINCESTCFNQINSNHHKLCMVYSYYDELVSNESNLSFYDKLKTINHETGLFISYNSTHNTCRKNYCEPAFTYLINDDRYTKKLKTAR
jgi:predicted peptidase